MNIPQGTFNLDVRVLKLIDLVEVASSSLRTQGNEEDALALFRLRIKMREGLPFEQAKVLFDKHTNSLLNNKEEKHLA